MKKLSTLLAQRHALLHKAHLANLAFAYATLQRFLDRVRRAQLNGRVTLKHIAPQLERYCPAFVALDASQSVIEEHFSDEDVMELADVLAFLTGSDAVEVTFELDDISDLFLIPVRLELERAGIAVGRSTPPVEQPRRSE